MKKYYKKAEKWGGRDDSGPRVHQIIEPLNLLDNVYIEEGSCCLINFACDAGVIRNQGRPGAKMGPFALQDALKNLSYLEEQRIYDAGSVIVEDDHLEKGQKALTKITSILYQRGAFVVVLGGGHEVAFAHYQGIKEAFPQDNIGVIIFDAHFDLRDLIQKDNRLLGSSGTSFTQMHALDAPDFLYLGIQEFANTQDLFAKADQIGAKYFFADELQEDLSKGTQAINDFIKSHSKIYMSFCLDVVAESFAKGVSAPSPLGLTPFEVKELFTPLVHAKNLVGFDIAEMNPSLDSSGQTARLASQLIYPLFYRNRR